MRTKACETKRLLIAVKVERSEASNALTAVGIIEGWARFARPGSGLPTFAESTVSVRWATS